MEYYDIADQAYRYGNMTLAEAFTYLKTIEREDGEEAAKAEFALMEGHLNREIADQLRSEMGY